MKHLNPHKPRCACFIIILGLVLTTHSARAHVLSYVIGQDINSISSFMHSFEEISSKHKFSIPDGFMVYTAINDPRGLSEPVDHGAGINYANHLIKQYPDAHIIQIGLYMKHMLPLVMSGELDHNIARIGNWIKNSGKDIYLRIGYEFDNVENQYNALEFVGAYKYIVDYLRAMNVNNVHFVWHSIAWRDDRWPPYELEPWYPGNEYVDWIALSFFDSERSEERKILSSFAKRKGKPLMIAESSPFNQKSIAQKLKWMDKLFTYIEDSDVKLLSYINVDWDHLQLFKNKQWGDARLENNDILINTFLTSISKHRKGKQ